MELNLDVENYTSYPDYTCRYDHIGFPILLNNGNGIDVTPMLPEYIQEYVLFFQ